LARWKLILLRCSRRQTHSSEEGGRMCCRAQYSWSLATDPWGSGNPRSAGRVSAVARSLRI
jgi:hypothetical protein